MRNLNPYVFHQEGNLYQVDFIAASLARLHDEQKADQEARKLRMATQIEDMLKKLL